MSDSNRWLIVTALVLASCLLTADAFSVKVGHSSTKKKTIKVPGVKVCSRDPQNECCGHHYEVTVDTTKEEITVERFDLNEKGVDEAQGWQQELTWECADKEENLHLPVEVFVLSFGANCHVHQDIRESWKKIESSPNSVRGKAKTDQINMHTWAFNNYKGKFYGIQTGTNNHMIYRTHLLIEKGGDYKLVMQVGVADAAMLFINHVEQMRTNCREYAVTKTFKWAAGEVVDIEINWMDDGWSDALVLMYQGPDSNDNLVVIPGQRFIPHCKKVGNKCVAEGWTDASDHRSDCYVDTANDNACTVRTVCKKGEYNSQTLTATKDRKCVKCDSQHCDSNGNELPKSTTAFNGASVTRPPATTPASFEDDDPSCGDECGWRVRTCSELPSNRPYWVIDFIDFRNDGNPVEHHKPFLSRFLESGHSNSDNRATFGFGQLQANLDFFVFSPIQAFSKHWNYWLGISGDNDEAFLGIEFSHPQRIDEVVMIQGFCNERVNYAAPYDPGSSRGLYAHSCIVLEKWTGSAWKEVGRNSNAKACELTKITSTDGSDEVCRCTNTELNNKQCDPKCDTKLCNFDNGGCRECSVLHGHIQNGKVDSDDRSWNDQVEISCDKGYRPTGAVKGTCSHKDNKPDGEVYWKFGNSEEVTQCEKIPPAQCKKSDLLKGTSVPTAMVLSPQYDSIPDVVGVDYQVDFSCQKNVGDVGYQLSGSTVAVCVEKKQDDPTADPEGEWMTKSVGGAKWEENRAQCDVTECPTIESIQNAELKITSHETGHSEGALVTCDPGYNHGVNKFDSNYVSPRQVKVTCAFSTENDGNTWDKTQSELDALCKPVPCPTLSTRKGDVDPKLTPSQTPTIIGTTLQATCPTSYLVEGADQWECVADGDGVKWESSVTGEMDAPLCKQVTCSKPSGIDSNLRISPNPNFNGQQWSFDTDVTFSCKPGYDLIGDTTDGKCGVDSKFIDEATESYPTCEELECATEFASDPDVKPKGSNYNIGANDKVVYDEKVSVSCDQGYVLPQPSTVTCKVGDSVEYNMNGGYDNAVPVCQPRECPAVPTVANGNVVGAVETYTFQDTLVYVCEEGYGPGGSMECASNGRFVSKEDYGNSVLCCELEREYVSFGRCKAKTICEYWANKYETKPSTAFEDRECGISASSQFQKIKLSLTQTTGNRRARQSVVYTASIKDAIWIKLTSMGYSPSTIETLVDGVMLEFPSGLGYTVDDVSAALGSEPFTLYVGGIDYVGSIVVVDTTTVTTTTVTTITKTKKEKKTTPDNNGNGKGPGGKNNKDTTTTTSKDNGSAGSSGGSDSSSNNTTTIGVIVVILVAVIFLVVILVYVIKKKQSGSGMTATAFENPMYDQHDTAPREAQQESAGYQDVSGDYEAASAGNSAGYMDVGPSGDNDGDDGDDV